MESRPQVDTQIAKRHQRWTDVEHTSTSFMHAQATCNHHEMGIRNRGRSAQNHSFLTHNPHILSGINHQ